MAVWLLGAIIFRLREYGVGAAWVDAPTSRSVGMGLNDPRLEFRMGWYAVNGSGAISTGEMALERSVDGGAWVEIGRGKLMTPGYTDSEFVDHEPDWYQSTLELSAWPGSIVRLRGHVYWTTEGDSLIHTATVATDMTESGDLAEYFRADDHGADVDVLGVAPRRIRGIFNDPGTLALRVYGTKPTVLCERALVTALLAGDELSVESRDFIVRGKRPNSDLTTLVLEEVA